MIETGTFKAWMAGLVFMAALGCAGHACAENPAGSVNVVEKKATLELVKSDLEAKLGLTQEQKDKIATIRQDFKFKQLAIKNALNARNEALRQELDGDVPARAKADVIVSEIKALQAQLVDNRVDIVFKLRAVYAPRQIKLIKEHLEQQRKAIVVRKSVKKAKKTAVEQK